MEGLVGVSRGALDRWLRELPCALLLLERRIEGERKGSSLLFAVARSEVLMRDFVLRGVSKS